MLINIIYLNSDLTKSGKI